MKSIKTLLTSLVLSVSLTGAVMAAGGPMNQDLSDLAPVAQLALDAAHKGDKEAFLQEAKKALELARGKTDSASQQRIVGKLKQAYNIASNPGGDLKESAVAVEEAMTDMKKADAPKFGGGS